MTALAKAPVPIAEAIPTIAPIGAFAADEPTTAVLPRPTNWRIVGISAGVLTGAAIGTASSAGVGAPVLVGAVTATGAAFVVRTGAFYAARAMAVVVSAGIGGFVGNWLSPSH